MLGPGRVRNLLEPFLQARAIGFVAGIRAFSFLPQGRQFSGKGRGNCRQGIGGCHLLGRVRDNRRQRWRQLS
jgi:hypothetical protein